MAEEIENSEPPHFPVWDYLIAAQEMSQQPPPRPGLEQLPAEAWFAVLCGMPIRMRFTDGSLTTRSVYDIAFGQGKTTLDVVEEFIGVHESGVLVWDESTESHVFTFASTDIPAEVSNASTLYPRDVLPWLIEARDERIEADASWSLEEDELLKKLFTMKAARELQEDGWRPVKAVDAYASHDSGSLYSCLNCMRAVELDPHPTAKAAKAPEGVRFVEGVWKNGEEEQVGRHKPDCVFGARDVFEGLVAFFGEHLERNESSWALRVSDEFAESASIPQGPESLEALAAVPDGERDFLFLPSTLDTLLGFYGLDKSNLFTVGIRGEEFKWHEFFYGLEDIPTLVRKLVKGSAPRPGFSVKLDRPVVVELNSWRNPQLKLVTRYGVDYWGVYQKVASQAPVRLAGTSKGGREHWDECDIMASIRFTDQDLAEETDLTSYPVVVFGYPELGFGRDGTAFLNMAVNHAGQIGESFASLLPRREEPYTGWQN